MKKLTMILIIFAFASFAFAQSVEIKDSANETLLIINDEGELNSSVTIPTSGTAPILHTDKLYNIGHSLYWNGAAITASGSDGHSLDAADGSPVDAVYVDNGGKVGIGTLTPDEKLHIAGGNIRLDNYYLLGWGGNANVIHGSSTENYLRLRTNNTDKVIINADGNVGIGIMTPSSKLSVVGDGAESTIIYSEATGSRSIAVHGKASNIDDTRKYGGYFEAIGDSSIGVYGETNGDNPMHQAYAGYFYSKGSSGTGVYGWGYDYGIYGVSTGNGGGVGVYGDGHNVGGRFKAHGMGNTGVIGHADWDTVMGYGVKGICDNPAGYDFYADGDGIDWGTGSSIRWKRNIVEIDNPLKKISEIRGVYFDWDEEHGGQHRVGCIAEEVGKVLPEIVVYEENGIDAHGMDYSKLTPLLIEVAKAQQKLIEDLNKRIEYLESN